MLPTPPVGQPRARLIRALASAGLLLSLAVTLAGCCGVIQDAVGGLVDITVTTATPSAPASPAPYEDDTPSPTATPTRDPNQLSDRSRILDIYGYPDTFTAAFSPEEDLRIEAWNFYQQGVTWLFNDDTCTGFDVCPLSDYLPPYYTLIPDDVDADTTLNDLAEWFREEPEAGLILDGALATELGGEDLAVYWFGDGVMVICEGEMLRYVSTTSVAQPVVALPEGEEG